MASMKDTFQHATWNLVLVKVLSINIAMKSALKKGKIVANTWVPVCISIGTFSQKITFKGQYTCTTKPRSNPLVNKLLNPDIFNPLAHLLFTLYLGTL